MNTNQSYWNQKQLWKVISLIVLIQIACVSSFWLPPPPPFFNGNMNNGNYENNDNNIDYGLPGLIFSSAVTVHQNPESNSFSIISSNEKNPSLSLSSSTSSSGNSASSTTTSTEQITANTKNLLQNTITFWKNKWSSFFVKRERQKQQKGNNGEKEAGIENLKNIKITGISAPDSSILSSPILRHAGLQSQLIGNKLSISGVQRIAKVLGQHYQRMGYPLCSVTGATLSDDGICQLQTEEPILSSDPVSIAFAKEMVLDENGNAISFRKYRDQLALQSPSSSLPKRSELNTTYVQTTGKTRSSVIAKAIGLKKGDVFQWDAGKWRNVVNSKIWDKVLQVQPVRLQDGSVQLRVICEESNRRRIEYGVSKSLYTGAWEGEMDFENRNLFGGGEVASVIVKRGARDPEPSFHVRYQDDKFGQPHGYSCEVFQDYIGPKKHNHDNEDSNPLLTRKGLTFRLSTPFPQSIIQRSALSTSLERTSTRTGEQESIVSSTINLGPFIKELSYPTNARHSILTMLTTGARLFQSATFRPYTAATVLTRQVFPILRSGTSQNPMMNLAFRHSITSSTMNVPRHEANAAGVSAKIRGYSSTSNGPLSGSIMGTTELRFPFAIQTLNFGSGTFILFADWMLGQRKLDFLVVEPNHSVNENDDFDVSSDHDDDSHIIRGGSSSPPIYFRKASVGLGFRKRFQGIPVKCDFSLTQDGKLGSFFGIGGDFDVF